MSGDSKSHQFALLSMKKTLFRRKQRTLYFLKRWRRVEECTDEMYVFYVPKFIERQPFDINDCLPELCGEGWYQQDLLGNQAFWTKKEPLTPSNESVACAGFSSPNCLMLDMDLQREERVLLFSRIYPKLMKLGSSALFSTSNSNQRDLCGHKLGNYLLVCGQPISKDEQQWHINKARKIGVVNKAWAEVTKYTPPVERTNAQSKRKGHPKLIKFFYNGEIWGVREYFRIFNKTKDEGF
jgi:hypothetical protein